MLLLRRDPEGDRSLDVGRLPQALYAPAASIVDREIIVTNGGETLQMRRYD